MKQVPRASLQNGPPRVNLRSFKLKKLYFMISFSQKVAFLEDQNAMRINRKSGSGILRSLLVLGLLCCLKSSFYPFLNAISDIDKLV